MQKRIKLFVFLISLAGTYMVILSTQKYGAGVSTDSVNYLAAAKGLLSGKGYLCFSDKPFVEWALLYPTLLALAGWLGYSLAVVGRFMNAALFGLIILVSGLWLIRHIRFIPLVFFCLGAILLSVPLLTVSVYLWSEPLFILLSLLLIIEMEKYLQEGRFRFIVSSAIFAAAACLTHYLGCGLVLASIILLILKRETNLSRKSTHAIAFTLFSVFPLAIWFVRNKIVSSTFGGYRIPPAGTLQENIYSVFNVLSSWFLPFKVPFVFRAILPLFFLMLISLAIKDKKHKVRWDLTGVYAQLFVFSIIYTAVLLFISQRITFVSIYFRHLVYLLVPLMLAIFLAADAIIRLNLSSQKLKVAAVFLISIWLIYPFLRTVKNIRNFMHIGAGGYASDLWMNSLTVAYLKTHPLPDAQIYSNFPDAVYFFSGHPAKLSPTRESAEHKESYKGAYLVWFENRWREDLFDFKELRSVFKMETLTQCPDGGIYIIH